MSDRKCASSPRVASLPGIVLTGDGTVVGFLGVGVSLVTFMLGLRHLGTARTAAYFSPAPFIGALLSVVIFRDTITRQLIGAGVLMAIGLWLHLDERNDHKHDHEVLEHDHAHIQDEHAHNGALTEPHSHWNRHYPMRHKRPDYPDLHHRHEHSHG